MHTPTIPRATRRLTALGAPLLVLGLTAAACGSGGGATAGGKTGGGGGTTAHAAAGKGAVTIGTAKGHLTDASGRTVYLWTHDSNGRSTCSGACASAWPPVTTNGHPKATGKVAGGNLGTVARDDGSQQVTYSGHPLYYFAGDSGPGSTAGQGSVEFGAKWWMVSAAGSAVTTGGGSGSSGGGGGYGGGGYGGGY